MPKQRRVVVIADLHCGHVIGLTHPDFDERPDSTESPNWHLYKLRRELWSWFAKEVEALKPVDVVICNGDAIDGKGEKSGGTEELEPERDEQCNMAAAIIEEIGAKEVYMSYGTPYHIGHLEDWEKQVADKVKAVKIGGHDWLDVNGLVFDYRHFIPASSIPHGRHTAMALDHVWSELWAKTGEYPKGDVLLRSHVHYCTVTGNADWMGFITPALQWYGTKWGVRMMRGTVNFGLMHFDITNREDWTWRWHILRRKQAAAEVMHAK